MDAEPRPQTFFVKQEDGPEEVDEEDSNGYSPLIFKQHSGARSRLLNLKWPLVHAALILMYTVVALFVVVTGTQKAPLNDGPLHDLSLVYEQRIYPNLSGNPLWGPPSPILEDAWDKLLEGIHIRVTAAELATTRQSSVSLPEGGGHLAWLAMHHNLHCLRHVHKYTYRDIYMPDRTQHEEDHMKLHMDHCLEMMRQDSLCKVDTTLKTFEWLPDKDEPVFMIKQPQRTCVDWKGVLESTRHRQVDEEEVERLHNPLKAL